LVSSIGLGTYLGEADKQTDRRYTAAVVRAVGLGSNVIDSAINCRFQRSERSIGAALVKLAGNGIGRDELVIATKAGFLSFDDSPPADPREYFLKTYLETRLLKMDEIAAGSHSIAPRYLEHQLNRSLENLGVDTIDIFYLHNPETQLEEVDPDEFMRRLHSAFEFLESTVADGRARTYGTATWNAYRNAAQTRGFLNLANVVACAREVGGDGHHFGVVQLPYNLGMREAYTTHNQQIDGGMRSTLEVGTDLGLTIMASASMLQARLSQNLPTSLAEHLPGLTSDSQGALQFVRSTPGITTALVGMSQRAHVEENLKLTTIAPVSAAAIQTLLNAA
jgi:aryl-alcohol dehydrogenase-like predicted oxidoreductase